MLSLKQGATASVMVKKFSHEGLSALQPILGKALPAPIHLELSALLRLSLGPGPKLAATPRHWCQQVLSVLHLSHCHLLSNPPAAAALGFLSTSPNPTINNAHNQKFLAKTFSLQPVLSSGSQTPARSLFLSKLVAALALAKTIGWALHRAS